MAKVNLYVTWEERHAVFGYVEVEEEYVDNRSAVLEAIEDAKRNGYTFDTDPSSDPGMDDLRWEEV